MRLAQIELGDQAVFLGSRRTDAAGDARQGYEVTFAVMEESGRAAAANNSAARSPRAAAGGPEARLGSVAAQTTRPRPAPRAGMAADAGAFVSWKKFLRQVGSRNGEGPRADGDSAGGRRPAESRQATAAARGAALPHWREFVPGELRTEPRHEQVRVDDTGWIETNEAASPPKQPTAASAQRTPAAGQPSAADAQRPAGLTREDAALTPGSAARHTPAQDARRGPPAKAGPVPAVAAPRRLEEVAASAQALERLGAELEELRRMFERQQAGAAPLALPPREALGHPRLAALYHGLTENAVEAALAAEIVGRLRPAAGPDVDGKRLGALLAREVRVRFKTDSELGAKTGAAAIAALVGPSGAGKTTALAKLAFRCGLLRRRRVRLLSVDQLRIGAVEPLQAYAELMNLPLQIVDDFDRISQALDGAASGAAFSATGASGQENQPELVLIDTPGYGRREWERARRLAAAFSGRGDIDVHLVLDLRTKNDDLQRAIERFAVFGPAKLLFTRLDETATFGTMLNETVRAGLPVSFVSVGQRVPEDIVPAGEPELLRLLLRDRSSSQ
jgi:flagellar biosynthesis protein FlhF